MNNLATSNQRLESMLCNFIKMNTASSSGTGSLPSNTIANPGGELKAITTRSGLVLDEPFVSMPPPFLPPLVQKAKQINFVIHQRDPRHPNIPYPSRMNQEKQKEKDDMLKRLLSNKEKLIELANTPVSENCSTVILKKLPEKLDVFVPVRKFTFPADFVIVDYESDPRVPLILGRPFLRAARALIDVHGEEMILRDGDERLILNMRNDTSRYSNTPKKESINMIDIYNISHDEYHEDLFTNEKITNHPSGNPTFYLTSHTDLTSSKVNDDIYDPDGDIIENLLNLDKTKDLPLYHDNPLSGNTTYSSSSLPISETSDYSLEEFADELAHFTFLPGIDYLPFDAESDLREIEYLLNHDLIEEMDSILEDSVDKNFPDDNLVDTISEMFTDKHALDYSSAPL
ncbi:reverse transcriptase domain-containing protein [Tanacetum coccineum]